jgi:hypothetical protein
MAFRRVQGESKWMYLPVTPSTAIARGSLVAFSGGKLVPATAVSAPVFIVGVLRHDITATDADYALDRLVEVETAVENRVVWEFTTSGLVATDIGTEVDLLNATTVDRSASAVKVVMPTKVITSTLGQGLIKFNGGY